MERECSASCTLSKVEICTYLSSDTVDSIVNSINEGNFSRLGEKLLKIAKDLMSQWSKKYQGRIVKYAHVRQTNLTTDQCRRLRQLIRGSEAIIAQSHSVETVHTFIDRDVRPSHDAYEQSLIFLLKQIFEDIVSFFSYKENNASSNMLLRYQTSISENLTVLALKAVQDKDRALLVATEVFFRTVANDPIFNHPDFLEMKPFFIYQGERLKEFRSRIESN